MFEQNPKKYSSAELAVMYDKIVLKVTTANLSENAQKEIECYAPVNPVTGLRDNILSRLESDINESEKAIILSSLQKMPSSQRSNLSDDDMIQLLPSRYNSSNVDMDAVRGYMNMLVQHDIIDAQQQTVIDNTGKAPEDQEKEF